MPAVLTAALSAARKMVKVNKATRDTEREHLVEKMIKLKVRVQAGSPRSLHQHCQKHDCAGPHASPALRPASYYLLAERFYK
jgi:hypothetical protein